MNRQELLKALLVLVMVWFIITTGIAFLREAKALRRGRAALQAENAAVAWNWVGPFAGKYPNHIEGSYLAGAASIELLESERAISFLQRLRRESAGEKGAKRAIDLETDIRRTISKKIAVMPCYVGSIKQLYSAFEPLGPELEGLVRSESISRIQQCVIQGDNGHAMVRWWVETTDDPTVIGPIYLEPIRLAAREHRFSDVRSLATKAIELNPEAEDAVDEALVEIRSAVGETVSTSQSLCREIRGNPGYRIGRFRCFPQHPPEDVESARDGWGRPFEYSSHSLDATIQCYQGFRLRSLGADNTEGPENDRGPDQDIECGFRRGREYTIGVDSFWVPADP